MPSPWNARIKKAVSWLGLAGLKAFRGLICEQKAGGWELSKGACMAWILFYEIVRMAHHGALPWETLLYAFGGLMGYNAFKLSNLKRTP